MAISDIPAERASADRTLLTLSDLPQVAINVVTIVVKMLASLRLTVVLFALAIFLVWIGTLAEYPWCVSVPGRGTDRPGDGRQFARGAYFTIQDSSKGTPALDWTRSDSSGRRGHLAGNRQWP